MAFNFTDELGFQEGQASPSDDLIIRTLDGGNITTTGSVKFTEHGVYAELAGVHAVELHQVHPAELLVRQRHPGRP
jgi:hypothetical protein